MEWDNDLSMGDSCFIRGLIKTNMHKEINRRSIKLSYWILSLKDKTNLIIIEKWNIDLFILAK